MTGTSIGKIQDTAYEYQQRVDSGEEVVVDVSQYTMAKDTDPDLLQLD